MAAMPGMALATSGACGSSAGKSLTAKPENNLCSVGTASSVSGSGPWTWTCTAPGYPAASCQAEKSVPPVNGSCGISDGKTLTAKPTSNLCSSGVATSVSGSGPWTWSCSGENGGSSDVCSADKVSSATCGNGTKESSEACDDGNSKSGDGCSSTCLDEKDDDPKDDDKDSDCDGSIGDFVWNDKNGDGVQDAGEAGIAGVGIWLYQGDDIDKEKTDSKGKYEFDNLCEGHYKVIVKSEDVPFRTLTSDPDGTKDHMTKVSLDNNQNYTKGDFGYKSLVAPATGPGWVAILISAASAIVALAVIAKMLSRKRKESAV